MRIPFQARCGFSPIFERRGFIYKQNWVTGVVGGQLSYEDDTCQAPIVTVNEAWYGRWPYDMYPWQQGRPAPFSARRSMVVDDALVSEDDQLKVWETLDKSVSLVGGIRYIDHRYDAALNRSITTKAEVYADAWSCTVWPMWLGWYTRVDCDWHYSFPFALVSSNSSDYAPSGSFPLPIAHSASALHPVGAYLINMRIGGVTSRGALRAWSTTPLPAAEHTDAGVGYGGGVGYSGGVGAVYGQSVAPPHSSSLSISSSPSSSTSSYSTSTSPTSTSPTSPTSSSPSSPSHAHSSNVSLLVQPSGYRSRQLRSTGGSTLDEVMASRYRLPMAWPVDEAELNDPTSSFHMGSDEVVSHTMPYLWVQVKTQLTMLSDGQARGTTMAASTSTSSTLATSTSPTATQPAAAAAAAAASPSSTTTPLTHASTALTPPSIPLIPSSSSTPLTISSSSTPLTLSPPPPPPPLLTDGSRRRSFDFRAGRLEHAMASTWNTAIVSGGRQGQAYSNDWLTYEPSFCLWPEDPSYADELGPVRFVYRDDPDWSGHAYYLSAAAAAALASSAAAHHHTITLASHHITSTSHHTMSRYHTRTHP